MTRLLDAAATKGRSPADRLRNRCLLELLYATGMRVTELVGLPVAAVRGDPRMILVRGKGDKERMVPLSGPGPRGAGRLAGRTATRPRRGRAQAGQPALALSCFPATGARGT